MKKIILNLFALTLFVSAVSAQKIEVKDIVSKHLASGVSPAQKTKVTNITAGPDEKKGWMSVEGTKKLGGKEVNVVSYNTRGGSGLGIKMFFEADTGRHVRTEYRRNMTESMARTREASASLTNDIIEEMSEDFGDIKTEAGVTLPTSYKIRVAQIHGTNSTEVTYTTKVATFYDNQQLDAATFQTEAND